MSDLHTSYYIGNPADGQTRGQNKTGKSVLCLLWLMIYKKGEFFSKPDEYALGHGGGKIGKAKSITEAREKLHAYAVNHLKKMLKHVMDEAKRIEKALEILGDDPANIERFAGEYDNNP